MLFALLLCSLLAVVSSSYRQGATYSGTCQAVDTINVDINKAYCNQPLFVTFLPKTEENQLLDNICYTYFPLPDDPDTFHLYVSRVFCDGSNDVTSYIETEITIGINRKANPYLTVTDHIIGYAGCDTYIEYRCPNFGDYYSYTFGISTSCKSIGLSCLRKVEEIIQDHCLPEEDYYLLPMKLPNRCVTQQLCITPPNPFYNKLGVHGVGHF